MSKAQQLLTRLDEFMGTQQIAPSTQAIHKATHSLVHADAQRAAKEHAERFKTTLQNKGLSKSYVDSIGSRIEQSAYDKHYKRAYTGTKREVSKAMTNPD